jgi:putative transposase
MGKLESFQEEEPMKPSQHMPDQILKIIEQAAKGDQSVPAICREHGIAENTFYCWRKVYSGMAVNEVQRLKELEKENSWLKRLLAERGLEIDLLKEVLERKPDDDRSARCSSAFGRRRAVGTGGMCPGTYPSVDVSVHRALDRQHRLSWLHTMPRFCASYLLLLRC